MIRRSISIALLLLACLSAVSAQLTITGLSTTLHHKRAEVTVSWDSAADAASYTCEETGTGETTSGITSTSVTMGPFSYGTGLTFSVYATNSGGTDGAVSTSSTVYLVPDAGSLPHKDDSANRIAAGFMLTITVVGFAFVFYRYSDWFSNKLTNLLSRFEERTFLYIMTFWTVVCFTMILAVCAAPTWMSYDVSYGNNTNVKGNWGPWLLCPDSGDCSDSLDHFVAGEDAIVGTRFFILLAVLGAIYTVIACVLLILRKVAPGHARISFYVSMFVVVCSFIAMGSWAAYKNDVWSDNDDVHYSHAFTANIFAWIFYLLAAAMHLVYYLVNGGGTASGPSANDPQDTYIDNSGQPDVAGGEWEDPENPQDGQDGADTGAVGDSGAGGAGGAGEGATADADEEAARIERNRKFEADPEWTMHYSEEGAPYWYNEKENLSEWA